MSSIFKNWQNGSILVTDAGWGDSGKGKVVSALIPEIGVKVIGGHNAGHTIVTDNGELGLGLIPSSIIHPKVISVLGQEIVINPIFLINEISKLKEYGIKITRENLLIDPRSHIIMPWHEARDTLSEEARGKAAVGSLHLGVGWTYSDRVNRRGLRLSDLFEPDWKGRIKAELRTQLTVISNMRSDVRRKTGKPSKVKVSLDIKRLLEIGSITRKKLKPYLANTTEFIWKAIDRKAKIIFEDSHGAMLDISHGSWPFTTGVNTGLAGVYRSFGGKAVKSITKTIVCLKSYQTRVGGGPMPTENPGSLGIHLQEKGGEIGTRSGRKRRCGPLDIPLVSYGLKVLGLNEHDEIALTKLDVFSGLAKIPVCVAYSHKRKLYKSTPSANASFLAEVKPKFKILPGWDQDISSVRDFSKLPPNAQKYIQFVQKQLGVKITFVGVGKHKDATIRL